MALQSLDPGAAIIRITGKTGRFEFLMPAEMASLYNHTNNYEPQNIMRAGNMYASRSPTMLWHGGKDEPASLEITMVVGASIGIDTPGTLLDYFNRLLALGQAASNNNVPQEPPEVIKLQIGTWFARKALVLSVTGGVKRPFDPGTGLPYIATVNFSLQYVYDTLPTADSFRLDRG
jgi:hypothetical protein